MNILGCVVRPYLNADIEQVYLNVCLVKLVQKAVQTCLLQFASLKCRLNDFTSKVYIRGLMPVQEDHTGCWINRSYIYLKILIQYYRKIKEYRHLEKAIDPISRNKELLFGGVFLNPMLGDMNSTIKVLKLNKSQIFLWRLSTGFTLSSLHETTGNF